MDNFAHARFPIEDRSYIAFVKKELHSICVGLGFAPSRLGEIDIIVAEICSNILKHALRGEVFCRILGNAQPDGVELIAIDHGPGISDIDAMLKDGMSTTQTLGHGLGAIQRLSDFLDIYSLPGWGTILLCRIFTRPVKKPVIPAVQMGSIVVPMKGERFSGDGFGVKMYGDSFQLLVGDGLGHGADAHYAVSLAIEAFKKTNSGDIVEIIRDIHASIKKSRGLVCTILSYSPKHFVLKIAGVGNISTRLSGVITKSVLAYNGIVGSNIPNTMIEQTMEIESPQLIFLTSDGIKSGIDLLKYPKIIRHDLTILAAALYKDHDRGKDDSSVVVLRLR